MENDEISFKFAVCELFQSSSVRSVSVFSQSESCADASSSPVRNKHTQPLPDENSMIFPQYIFVLVNGNAILENFSRFRKIWKLCDSVCECIDTSTLVFANLMMLLHFLIFLFFLQSFFRDKRFSFLCVGKFEGSFRLCCEYRKRKVLEMFGASYKASEELFSARLDEHYELM